MLALSANANTYQESRVGTISRYREWDIEGGRSRGGHERLEGHADDV